MGILTVSPRMPPLSFEWVSRQPVPELDRFGMYVFYFKSYGKPAVRLYGDIDVEWRLWRWAKEIDIGDHWMGEDT